MPSTHSRSLKQSGKRSFTINNAYHIDDCPTKFSHKDYTGRFIAVSAQRAAEKALSELCHLKSIKGQCTLYIEMRETTQGSSGKLFAYRAKRYRLQKPVEVNGILHYYNRHATPVAKIPTEKCVKSHKSSGRMRSKPKHLSKQSPKHSAKHSSKSKSLTKKMTNTIKKTASSIKKSIKNIF